MGVVMVVYVKKTCRHLAGPHSLWQASSMLPLAGIFQSSQMQLCLLVAGHTAYGTYGRHLLRELAVRSSQTQFCSDCVFVLMKGVAGQKQYLREGKSQLV